MVNVNVVAVVARRASIVLLAERYTVAQTNCGVDVHTVERNFPHPWGPFSDCAVLWEFMKVCCRRV
jgi:hypothetical protein